METFPLEFFLFLIVIFLGVLAAAASVQVFLLHKLIRELGRAYEGLDTARKSLGLVLQDLAAWSGTVSSTLNKGRDTVSALYETAEAVRTIASDAQSIVKNIFVEKDKPTAGNGTNDTKGPERRGKDPVESRSAAKPRGAATDDEPLSAVDDAEEEELLVYERPDNREVR